MTAKTGSVLINGNSMRFHSRPSPITHWNRLLPEIFLHKHCNPLQGNYRVELLQGMSLQITTFFCFGYISFPVLLTLKLLLYTVNNYMQVTGMVTGENFAFFIYRHFVEIL